MNDVDFYSVLNQLWLAMVGAIKTPKDALVIGSVGNEITQRLELSKRKAEVPPASVQQYPADAPVVPGD